MDIVVAVLGGIAAGTLIWFVIVRPIQLDNHERHRRDLGFRPRRELPEDKKGG